MAPVKRRKKRKKVRYHTLAIKLTTVQRRSLMNYCSARKTTPTKLVKKMIRPFLKNYSSKVPEAVYATENQLELFGQEA